MRVKGLCVCEDKQMRFKFLCFVREFLKPLSTSKAICYVEVVPRGHQDLAAPSYCSKSCRFSGHEIQCLEGTRPDRSYEERDMFRR